MQIRAITENDADLCLSVVNQTTEEDRYCRFFHCVQEFDNESVQQFLLTNESDICLIAHDENIGYGIVQGFITNNIAEVAIIVAKSARRHNVGHELMVAIIDEVHARGCHTIEANTLGDNAAFRHLARSVGMKSSPPASQVVWTLTEEPQKAA